MRFDFAQCKQKGLAQLLLILAIATLIITGIYFLAQRKEKNQPLIVKRNQVVEVKFKEYTNPKLGLSFKYTKELTVKSDSEEEYNKRENGNYRKNFKGYVGYEPESFLGAVVVLDKTSSFALNPFSVWVFNNDKQISIEQWFTRFWYYPFVWGVFDWTSKGHIALDKEATISGQIAKYKIITYQPGSPKFIYVSKNNKMYLFRIIGKTGEEILSAFTFLQ